MVNLRRLKDRMSAMFPGKTITEVLKNEPDEIGPEELIGKIATWQSVIDSVMEVKK